MEEDEDAFTLKVWLFIWRTFVQLFYIAVVLAVFSNINTAQPRFIAAMAGILYTTIRSGFVGLHMYLQTALTGAVSVLDRINATVSGAEPEIVPLELEKQIKKVRAPLYYEMVGLSVVFFICLFQAFEATSSGQL